MHSVAFGFVTAFLAALALTPVIRSFAQRAGMVAKPWTDRWHSRPTALMGGIAIFLSFLFASLLVIPPTPKLIAILAGGTILFIAGLIDDLIQIRPHSKLVMQLIVAAGTVSFGIVLPWTGSGLINTVVTIFWIVGITNAINLLDNMDGLAAGISAISCIFLVITFLLNGQNAEAVLASALCGAALGFLKYNFNPASMFMGDCGSMFLGFVLATIALLSDYGRSRNVASVLFTPVLILLIPIFDTCIVTVTRKLSGRRVSQGGRDHTSHRLVALGMTERRAVFYLYAFAALCGTAAIIVRFTNAEIVLLLVPSFTLCIIGVGFYLGMVRIHESALQPKSSLVNAFANLPYKRRVVEVLLDLVLIAISYYGAYLLRFDGSLSPEQIISFSRGLPVVIILQLSCFLIGGMYRGLWRYVGIDDLIVIAKNVFVAIAVSWSLLQLMDHSLVPARGLIVVDMLLLFITVGASRISFRLIRSVLVDYRGAVAGGGKLVLIYGAGDGGELLMREILNNPAYKYRPLGFVDDDANKKGKVIHGFRVFDREEVPSLLAKHGKCELVVSSLKVPESKIQEFKDMGLALRRLNISIE